MDGRAIPEIAAATGVSTRTIRRDIEALPIVPQQVSLDIAAIRQSDAARLEEMIAAGHRRFLDRHDPRVLTSVIRAMERRAKMLGLDSPARADVTSGGQPLEVVRLPTDMLRASLSDIGLLEIQDDDPD